MFDVEKFLKLTETLSFDERRELRVQLFGTAKTGFSYFRRYKDISMRMLEIISDYFKVPLDAFRKDAENRAATAEGRGRGVSASSKLQSENDILQERVKHLEETLKSKNEVISAKNEVILAKTEELNALRSAVARAGTVLPSVGGSTSTAIPRDLTGVNALK